jgi:hypothetical protein
MRQHRTSGAQLRTENPEILELNRRRKTTSRFRLSPHGLPGMTMPIVTQHCQPANEKRRNLKGCAQFVRDWPSAGQTGLFS